MVTVIKVSTAGDGSTVVELRGKTTDAKPTTAYLGYTIGNGSTFYVIDTGALFMFDADTSTWVEQ